MPKLTRLALLAVLVVGCTCGNKGSGPVPRPARVHAWGSLGNVEQSFGDVATLAGRFGFPLAKDSLRDVIAKGSGLGPELLAEVDLSHPIWTAGVRGEGKSAGYTYVYAVPLRDEKKFLAALRNVMTESRTGDIVKLTPKGGGGSALGTLFMVTEDRHALFCQEQAALDVAREWLLRSLVATPAKDDLTVTFTSEFLASWQQTLTDLANAQGSAVAGFAQRMASRARTVSDLSVRVDLAPEAVVIGARIEAPSGAMHDVLVRQMPGPPYALGAMPAETWLYYTDRYAAASLAESALDAKEALKKVAAEKRESLGQALERLVGALSGEIALGGSGPMVIAAAKVRDAKAAREGLDVLVEWLTGASQVRRDGSMAVVDLPVPGGFVPPLIAGKPAVATFVEGDRLLIGVGIEAEARVREALAGTGARLDKDAAFAKTAPAAPGRVGLVYVSVARMLRSMVAAVPGAPVPSAGDESPGILLDWQVRDTRTAMDITLRAPIEAFAALAPVLRALPLGGFRP